MGIMFSFLLQFVFIPPCLWASGWLLKRHIEPFPNHYIPFALMILSVVMCFTLSPRGVTNYEVVELGILIAIFCVGCHSIVKDILIRKGIKRFKQMTRHGERGFKLSISEMFVSKEELCRISKESELSDDCGDCIIADESKESEQDASIPK